MTSPNFNGRRVLAFESRRAKEIDTLIANFGGRPLVAPAMREMANESDAAALAFIDAIVADRFDVVIFLTGVGVRALLEAASRAGRTTSFLDALRRVKVVARGPKPVAVLREVQVPVWLSAPEPNTWRELLASLDAQAPGWTPAGSRVAVQEYGVSNTDLLDALRERGAGVTAVAAYQWAMPEDVAPLQEAARALAQGEIDVVIVTSGIQIVHFWRVVEALGLATDVRRGMRRAVVASIGPSASAELRRYGFEPTFEPSHPRMGFLVREAAGRVLGC